MSLPQEALPPRLSSPPCSFFPKPPGFYINMYTMFSYLFNVLFTCRTSNVLFACKFHKVRTISVLLTFLPQNLSICTHNRNSKIYVKQINEYMQMPTQHSTLVTHKHIELNMLQTFDFPFAIYSSSSSS